MDPSLIAILALIASALQVVLLRAADYFFPRGHTRSDDKIAETKAGRKVQRKVVGEQGDDFTLTDDEGE